MQELRMRIYKFQLYSSLAKKIKVKNEKKKLLKYHPYRLVGPVATASYETLPHLFSPIMLPKEEGAIDQQQKAYSMLTNRKIFLSL